MQNEHWETIAHSKFDDVAISAQLGWSAAILRAVKWAVRVGCAAGWPDSDGVMRSDRTFRLFCLMQLRELRDTVDETRQCESLRSSPIARKRVVIAVMKDVERIVNEFLARMQYDNTAAQMASPDSLARALEHALDEEHVPIEDAVDAIYRSLTQEMEDRELSLLGLQARLKDTDKDVYV